MTKKRSRPVIYLVVCLCLFFFSTRGVGLSAEETRGGWASGNYQIQKGGGELGVYSDGENLHVSVPLGAGMRDEVYLFIRTGSDDPRAAPWNRDELVYFDLFNSPWWKIRVSDGEITTGLNDCPPGKVENGRWLGSLNIKKFFGEGVRKIEIASVKTRMETNGNLQRIVAQFPGSWDRDGSLQGYEFQKINLDSVEDLDSDGYHDQGTPILLVSKTGEAGGWKDGNYGLLRYYIDEVKKEKKRIFVRFQVNTSRTLDRVELFTNVNRRDFVVMDPSTQTVEVGKPKKNYYSSTRMRDLGGGWFEANIPVEKCGVYRLQARYRFEGNSFYTYYTDGAMRLDCAVVVSPSKARDMVVYETNPATAGATADDFLSRGTISSLAQVSGEAIPGFSQNPLAGLFAQKGIPTKFDDNFYKSLGVNTLWVQPIHPIGEEWREIDPETKKPYEPGSPYAVKDYWAVNPLLSPDNNSDDAMREFQSVVKTLDSWGIAIMMDGTFNHCAPDAIMGEGAELIGLGQYKNDRISTVRPQWFSKKGFPGQAAKNSTELMRAPDRFDFSPWKDVVEFNYGVYEELVKRKPEKHPLTGMIRPSGEKFSHLLSGDTFYQHTPYTMELWEYMSNYPRYWISRTGHPVGTPKEKSHLGVDGIRCDFAQGLPSHFWEYCINKTRKLKWDFVFMAESLDGVWYDGDGRPVGVGYRSARQFDIMNENIVFYWRNQFFGYPASPSFHPEGSFSTWLTRDAYLSRWRDMDGALLLNNLVNHDEVFPHNDPLSIFHAYAQLAALPGVPMIFYGQEAGAQNCKVAYAFTEEKFGEILRQSNFSRYESNMGKVVPSFKSYNNMTQIWEMMKDRREGEGGRIRDLYGQVNNLRLNSDALRSEHCLFLTKWGAEADTVDHIFAVVRVSKPYSTDDKRDVVLAFVNNNYLRSPDAGGFFSMNLPRKDGVHYAGIEVDKKYRLRNLLSGKESFYKDSIISGETLLAEPLDIKFPLEGRHVAYFRLEEVD